MGGIVKLCIAAVVLLAAVYLGHSFYAGSVEDADPARYRLAPVSRGPLASTVTASGKLKAVVTVDVGTQVSGLIESLNADYNSVVEAGQVIARIDAAPFEARLHQAEAELAVTRASVAMQQATQEELGAQLIGHRAALTEASEELRRKRALKDRGAAASSAVDTALAKHEQAKAQVRAAQARLSKQEAQIELVSAQVQQKAAVVEQRRLELEDTYIRSPVTGVVVSRNVDAGQTVAASLQAPVLFRIAQDLTRMQVDISVDEADIGQIRVGQMVVFTVDAYARRPFEGRVHQIRKAGLEFANVVTYTVVATADNPDQSLLPGMTATATIVINEKDDVLKVPTAAFYYHPPGAEPGYGKRIWILDEAGKRQPVEVTAGITDSIEIEIIEGALSVGQLVILGVDEVVQAEKSGWFRWGF